MEFPYLTYWTVVFRIKGLLGCKFQFHSNFTSIFCEQKVHNHAASDLVKHCLSMCHKNDAMFMGIWVNT